MKRRKIIFIILVLTLFTLLTGCAKESSTIEDYSKIKSNTTIPGNQSETILYITKENYKYNLDWFKVLFDIYKNSEFSVTTTLEDGTEISETYRGEIERLEKSDSVGGKYTNAFFLFPKDGAETPEGEKSEFVLTFLTEETHGYSLWRFLNPYIENNVFEIKSDMEFNGGVYSRWRDEIEPIDVLMEKYFGNDYEIVRFE